ncbi:MAG: glucose-6-phosphate isomerase [Oscillospiraceae bacterium]
MDAWNEFKNTVFYSADTKMMMDWGGMALDDEYLASMKERTDSALKAMDELEAGAIANPDEGRMVGHYWLRNSALAPTQELKDEIDGCLAKIKAFAADVHSGKIVSEKGSKFKNVIVAGIGGSSLGPVFVSKALSSADDKMSLYFMDNTDPAGFDNVFAAVKPELDETLTIIISKSGGTIETRNCMVEAKNFYEQNGLSFARHAVCVTGDGSKLDKVAVSEGWLQRFPMWDWVGGRTSVMSAVGLLPLALQGLDIDGFLKGAADCDKLGRNKDAMKNPAAIMALSWYKCTGGEGGTTQVVLPYKDSLDLLAKYLQQLSMESLGKELDLDGKKVNQGLAVMGNKGTSDQHSYVQQLVGGPYNIFVTFVQVLRDRCGGSVTVGEDSTSGDYLNAFMLGTKKALESHGKHTMTITVPTVDAYNVGQLIAVYERAVSIYALFININAYHQPAVEFGKKAANGLIEVKNAAAAELLKSNKAMTAVELAAAIGAEAPDVFRLMMHLCENDGRFAMEYADPVYDSTFRSVK